MLYLKCGLERGHGATWNNSLPCLRWVQVDNYVSRVRQLTFDKQLFNKRSRPPLPPDIVLSSVALDFLNEKCLATDPRNRPMARDLLQHEFIKDKDLTWTFKDSKIGKAVAKRGAKRPQA